MTSHYLLWAFLALGCYSIVSPLVSVVSREIPSNVVALITNGILAIGALVVVLYSSDPIVPYLTHPKWPYMLVAGLALTVGILSYYRALALGPVSVVVPIFALFLVGSSVIGIVFLQESLTARKAAGIAFAALAVILTSVE